MRRQWHDDVVHLQRGMHSAAAGYSQWCLQIILIMALYYRQGFQAWFLLVYSKG
jgi:hypothetical protein